MYFLHLLVVSCLTAHSLGCHNGCPTMTAATYVGWSCNKCCWDGNQGWAVEDQPGYNNQICNTVGGPVPAGACYDFTANFAGTGSVNPSTIGMISVGVTATVTCNSPYYLVGSATVTCNSNSYSSGGTICTFCGMWTTIPTCQLGCTVPVVANSVLPISISSPLINGVAPNTAVATITCASPYYRVGSATVTCASGSFGVLPHCLMGCPIVTPTANMTVSYNAAVVSGTTLYANTTRATITCDSGTYLSFTPVAPVGVCTNGNWGTLPTCLLGCTASAILNGVVTYNQLIGGSPYPAGTVATFNCSAGYYLNTLQTLTTKTCTSGIWGTIPTCIRGCNVTAITNGQIVFSQSAPINYVYQAASTAQFACNTGYYLSTLIPSTTLTCSSGTWGTEPTCIRGCNATDIINGGIVFTPVTVTNYVYRLGSTASFNCTAGYYLSTLTPSLTLTCTAGTWGSEPTCIQGCLPTSINNGTIVYNPVVTTNGLYQSTATATFTCITGFYLDTLNPTEVQSCAAGAWGPTLTCLRGCSATSINNGLIAYNPATTTNGVYQGGTDARFTCDFGFYLSTMQNSTDQICSNGIWGASLSCLAGCFEYENVTSGQIAYSPDMFINAVYANGSIAQISCLTNYYTSGIQNAMCLYGNWTSDLYCILGCQPLQRFDNGKTSYNPSTVSNLVYQTASVATFQCQFGYKLIGSKNANCQNGSWNNPVPSCQAAPWEILIIIMDISCTFLIIACGSTFMTFLLLREFSIETILHMGEELSLFCAHVLILLFRYRVDLGELCRYTGILLQYFFIVAYTFFLLESLQFFCILQNIISFGGPWEHPRFRLLVIGWAVAFIPTGLTVAFRFDYYTSTFSCWVNLGSDIAIGSFAPICILFVLTVIFTEAAAMNNIKPLPLADWPQIIAARFNQKSILIIMGVCTCGWFIGMFASYSLTLFLGLTVSAMNVTLGICIWMFHYMGTPASNKWFNKNVRRRLCKKKPQSANTTPVEEVAIA